jgi:uncharacterized protein DUF6544
VRPTARRPRPPGPPRGLTEQARADWAALAQPTPATEAFDPTAVAGLPEPVRCWLAHAITPGTPLRSSAELRMPGEIRLGAWRPFTAVQRLTPGRGFLWAATRGYFAFPSRALTASPAAPARCAGGC